MCVHEQTCISSEQWQLKAMANAQVANHFFHNSTDSQNAAVLKLDCLLRLTLPWTDDTIITAGMQS